MGGKRLKFPVRQKYVDESKFSKFQEETKEEVSEEEHQKRIEMLKKMGLLKE